MRPQVDSDDPNGPRAPLRSNFDDPDGWEPAEPPSDHFSFPTSVDGLTGEVHHMAATTLGSSQPRAGFAGRPTRDLAHPCPIHCPPVELRERETAVNLPLQPCLDVPAGFLRATRRVNNRLL